MRTLSSRSQNKVYRETRNVMWSLSLSISVTFAALAFGQVCKISSVQVDNENGGQQYIQLNLKKVDVDDEGSCPGCSVNDDSISGGYQYSKWTSTPPTFKLAFTPGELIPECDSDTTNLPHGLCSKASSPNDDFCGGSVCSLEDVEELAEAMEEKHLLPLTTGNEQLDHKLAMGIVLLNLGNVDKAIEEFSSILAVQSNSSAAYFARGAAYARKNVMNVSMARQALADFNTAIQLDANQIRTDILIHRAEILMILQMFQEAYKDADIVLQIKPLPKVYFLRGVISLFLENFAEAEQDFRMNLQSSDLKIQRLSHFHLGLALYYRGKVRNAVEVFKEVLKENPNHYESSLSLAQGFRELGNIRAAMAKFNQTLQLKPDMVMVYNLRGSMMYDSGDHRAALVDYEKCLQVDSNNANCHYLQGASKIILGQFYDGVKDMTKLMVTNIPVMKASPDHIKAHYLREYGRYVHSRLDSPVDSLQPEVDFTSEYLDHWVRLKKFNIKNYREQPGLQPDIRDVTQLREIPANVHSLICRAEALGKLSQVSVDGILPNRRLNLAMGLASIHIAQYFEAKWKELKAVAKSNSNEKVIHSWRELFSIGIYYRRLASLDQPILWVDRLPAYRSKEGFRSDIPFVRGSVTNGKVTPYFELAFKLAKTMLEHYSRDGAIKYSGLKEDLAKASTCDDLLNVARRRQINPHGFLVCTQVPSLLRVKDDTKLDGGVLVLTEDVSQKIVFTLNIANTPDRTASYSAEMDHLVTLLQDEVRKMGTNKVTDVENIISHILSILYYFYNLIPLSKGSSAVAYSMVLGLLMSVGRQITGRIPNGRLPDMEAMLAGAPDAFALVAKNWMAIKKTSVPVASLPRVWEALPTVRSVLEILSVNTTTC